MSAQAHDFSNPARRESDLQRKMREFDAQKSKGVSYSPDTYDPATTKRDSNGTPFNAAATGPYAPPSPDRAGGRVPNRTNTHHTPEGSDNEEYKRNIHATGGNGRDKVESWVGNKLPRPRTHGNEDDEDRLKYADAIKVTTKDGDIVQEWNGKKDPKVRTHHNWSDSESQGEGRTSDNERPEPQVRSYKDERGNDVQEAKGDNTPIRAHHTWAPDSEAQAALDSSSGGIKTRKDRDGNDVQEADGDIAIRTHGYDNDEERSSKKSSKKEKSHKRKKSSSGSGDIVTRTDRNGDIVQEAKGDIGLRVYGGDASKEDEKAEKARRKAAKKERKEREKTLSRSNTHQESYGEDHVRYENSDDDEDELETGYDSEGNEFQAGNQGGRIRAHAAGW